MKRKVAVFFLVVALLIVVLVQNIRYTGFATKSDSFVGVDDSGAIESEKSSVGKIVDYFTPRTNLCGNGNIDSGEDCDVGRSMQVGCRDLGSGNFIYEEGTLRCRSDCTFDSSACIIREDCPADVDGNRIVNQGDRGFISPNLNCKVGYGDPACDASDVDRNGVVNSGDRGVVSANVGPCQSCGDNVAEGNEICDGSDMKQAKCEDFGYDGGVVSCLQGCGGLDFSQCTTEPVCGDNFIEGGEICECGLDGICGNGDDAVGETSCSDLRSNLVGVVSCSACLDYDDSQCSLRGVVLDIPPSERTADLPDSWLVLYNENNPESVEWKNWYVEQWGIPEENTLGLDVSNNEKITRDQFTNTIFLPVQTHLKTNPELNSRIMGIIVGYRVPGNFYIDSTHPQLQGGGGWSVANNLADMAASTAYERFNGKSFSVNSGIRPRLTKENMNNNLENIYYGPASTPGKFYMTARIDAPTLEEAKDLTRRARAITIGDIALEGDVIHYDYQTNNAAVPPIWQSLKNTVEIGTVTSDAEYAWAQFGFPTPAENSGMRFSYYYVVGWQNVQWADSGARVLHYALDSFGATTVRSTTGLGGRAVPNALSRGEYAAAIGSTSEPFGNEAYPDTIVWALREGQTLGEAFFQANPRVNFMWELDGDPLMRLPGWFA